MSAATIGAIAAVATVGVGVAQAGAANKAAKTQANAADRAYQASQDSQQQQLDYQKQVDTQNRALAQPYIDVSQAALKKYAALLNIPYTPAPDPQAGVNAYVTQLTGPNRDAEAANSYKYGKQWAGFDPTTGTVTDPAAYAADVKAWASDPNNKDFISQFIPPSSPTAPTSATDLTAELEATPGYQFTVDQANKAATRSAAARGLLKSGATLTAVANNTAKVADTTYNSYADRLKDLANPNVVLNQQQQAQTGANAVTNILQTGTQQSNSYLEDAATARASGYSAFGDIAGSTIGGLNKAAGLYYGLKQYSPYTSGVSPGTTINPVSAGGVDTYGFTPPQYNTNFRIPLYRGGGRVCNAAAKYAAGGTVDPYVSPDDEMETITTTAPREHTSTHISWPNVAAALAELKYTPVARPKFAFRPVPVPTKLPDGRWTLIDTRPAEQTGLAAQTKPSSGMDSYGVFDDEAQARTEANRIQQLEADQSLISNADDNRRSSYKTGGRLNAASRRALPDSVFALPGRRYPIHDLNHARAALSMVAKYGTPEEKKQVRAAVHERYPQIDRRMAEGGRLVNAASRFASGGKTVKGRDINDWPKTDSPKDFGRDVQHYDGRDPDAPYNALYGQAGERMRALQRLLQGHDQYDAPWDATPERDGGRVRRATGGGVNSAAGLVDSDTAGREDAVNMEVPDGAYVIPADIVSGMGQGNTMAGEQRLREMLGMEPENPDETTEPIMMPNDNDAVPIQASGGEFIVPPEKVAELGHGDADAGFTMLDSMVKELRQSIIENMKQLPGPMGSDETAVNKARGGKVEKVMHEFKHGTLHSGSKRGPKVRSRQQAIAIALSEAGMSKRSSGGSVNAAARMMGRVR